MIFFSYIIRFSSIRFTEKMPDLHFESTQLTVRAKTCQFSVEGIKRLHPLIVNFRENVTSGILSLRIL